VIPVALRFTTVRVTSALLLAVAAASGVHAWSSWSALEETRARLAVLRSRPVTSAPAATRVQPQADFTAQWPVSRIDDEVLDNALRDAQRLGVRITAATGGIHPESQELLRQSQLNIEARGTYGNIKNWLTEVIGRQSGLAVDALEVRRVDLGSGGSVGPPEVAAAVRLRLFMRPKEGR